MFGKIDLIHVGFIYENWNRYSPIYLVADDLNGSGLEYHITDDEFFYRAMYDIDEARYSFRGVSECLHAVGDKMLKRYNGLRFETYDPINVWGATTVRAATRFLLILMEDAARDYLSSIGLRADRFRVDVDLVSNDY